MAVELVVPSAGESITEVMIVEWRVAEGEYVKQDDPVVEIETDKASMEVPAPVSGILTKRRAGEGDTIDVGAVLAEFEPQEQPAPTDQGVAKTGKTAAAESGKTDNGSASTTTTTAPADTGGNGSERVVMPAAQRLITEHNLDPNSITPTGPGGRILKEDVDRHLARVGSGAKTSTTASPAAPATTPGQRHEEAVPMTMLRRRIAQRLVEAQHTTASLTTFNEADMSSVMALRKQYQPQFEKKYGIKLGFMSFFVKAAIDALKTIPSANAEIRGNDLVYRNYFDIGVAVSTPNGLVVPVIRDAELLSFAEVEQSIADLATRARDRKLTVEELQGGTFSITNGGIFGSMMSTPILNPPQSAILGMHAINERPIAIDGQVVIRPMMYLALTYDHRILDGREAVTFLKRIKDCIEDPTRILVEV